MLLIGKSAIAQAILNSDHAWQPASKRTGLLTLSVFQELEAETEAFLYSTGPPLNTLKTRKDMQKAGLACSLLQQKSPSLLSSH